MSLSHHARKLTLGAVRSSRLGSFATAVSARSLRVLAYHDVSDVDLFHAQIRWLTERFEPVSATDVIAGFEGSPLPRRAVWVTFDDGDPSVVEHALPSLQRCGVQATMYVCPGLIGGDMPTWWDIVSAAPIDTLQALLHRRGDTVDDAIRFLKTVPDAQRRRIIEQLPQPPPSHRRQLSLPQIERWLAAGQHIGNHTWDHPVLDRCGDDEQRRQVRLADNWLRTHITGWTPLFAYPNGNWAPSAHDELIALGYASAVLHDHRLANPKGNALRVSRLHVAASDDIDRFASIVSGIQPVFRRAGDAVAEAYSARIRRRHT